jgi:hypothetical protein
MDSFRVNRAHEMTTRICATLFIGREPGGRTLSLLNRKKTHNRIVSREEITKGIRKQYAKDYATFLLVQMGYAQSICPNCQDNTFTTLWLADPRNPINGKLWAKWYFWCNECLCGIYCPLGKWRISRATAHVLYGFFENCTLTKGNFPSPALMRAIRV